MKIGDKFPVEIRITDKQDKVRELVEGKDMPKYLASDIRGDYNCWLFANAELADKALELIKQALGRVSVIKVYRTEILKKPTLVRVCKIGQKTRHFSFVE